MERYVCFFYGEKKLTSVDDARKKIFFRSFTKDHKVRDLSLLPPCQSSLLKHMQRANYVARIWRQSSQATMEIETPTSHGWNDELSVDWVTKPYPDDICELLVSKDLSDIEEYDESETSDDDEEQ